MGFFLVGRGRESGGLRLIAEDVFPDRQSALDALSRLSSSPRYEHGDSEVFVADLDTAVPILVVAPTPVSPATEVSVPTSQTDESVDAAEPKQPAAGVWEAPVETAALDSEPEDVVQDSPQMTTDDGPGAPSDDVFDEKPPLADALKGAAETMESEGIIAPVSVGPAEEPAADVAWPWEPADAESVPAEGMEASTIDDEIALEPAEASSAAAPAEADTASQIPEPYVPSDLEEPSVDDAPLVVDATQDETFDAPRPVIMGDYADTPASDPFDDIQADVDVMDPKMESMLADLDPISDSPPPPPGLSAPEVSPDPDTASLTCEDCVYVSTCPNKDDLEPGSCGNFQWKAV